MWAHIVESVTVAVLLWRNSFYCYTVVALEKFADVAAGNILLLIACYNSQAKIRRQCSTPNFVLNTPPQLQQFLYHLSILV